MTDRAFKPLTQGSAAPTAFLTTSAATYYTAPSQPDNTITMVRGLRLCNTTSSDETVRVHNIPSGGGAAASNAEFYDVTVKANSTVIVCYDEGAWVIAAGGFVQALCSASNAVTIALSGEERA